MSAVNITVTMSENATMGAGRKSGYPRPHIEVGVGRRISTQSLTQDWVLVADDQNWLAEGVATYVEGVARAQAGNISEAQLWEDFFKAMPQATPPMDRRIF